MQRYVIISLEDQHTAEEVPVIADAPGADPVHGFLSNTDVFQIMMAAFGRENNNKTGARDTRPGNAGASAGRK